MARILRKTPAGTMSASCRSSKEKTMAFGDCRPRHHDRHRLSEGAGDAHRRRHQNRFIQPPDHHPALDRRHASSLGRHAYRSRAVQNDDGERRPKLQARETESRERFERRARGAPQVPVSLVPGAHIGFIVGANGPFVPRHARPSIRLPLSLSESECRTWFDTNPASDSAEPST